MNTRAKAKLAAALRSGAFVKTQGAERRVSGGTITYCVIGVLGCVWAAARGAAVDTAFVPVVSLTGEFCVSPFRELKAWADLTDADITLLTRANDDDETPMSFNELAAIVEGL